MGSIRAPAEAISRADEIRKQYHKLAEAGMSQPTLLNAVGRVLHARLGRKLPDDCWELDLALDDLERSIEGLGT